MMHFCKKFSRRGDLLPGICAPLILKKKFWNPGGQLQFAFCSHRDLVTILSCLECAYCFKLKFFCVCVLKFCEENFFSFAPLV